jgi:large subunit ribosomal protein L17
MRHRVQDKKFNRTANERKAFFMGLLRNLVERGSITTTMTRAKELKRLADKMVGQAKDSSVASRRLMHRTFGKRDVVNTLVEKVAPAMTDRNSGYTRITALGSRRGDNTPMARIAFVNAVDNGEGGLQSGKQYAEVKEKKSVVVAKSAATTKAVKEVKSKKK